MSGTPQTESQIRDQSGVPVQFQIFDTVSGTFKIAGSANPLPISGAVSGWASTVLNGHSPGVASSLVVKTAAGTVYGGTVYNSSASIQYIHLFDLTALPANGTTPKLVYPINPKQTLAFDYGNYGRIFNNGIVISNSTTDITLTIGASDCIFDVQYL